VSARSAIENTLYRYAWTYDMDELAGIGECFTEDAEVVFGTGLQVGRDAVVAELTRRRAKYRPEGTMPWHVITNVFIRSETAQEAEVAAFYTFFTKPPDGPPAATSIGHYDDVFVEDGGVWRVRRRTMVPA
jgi:hypothetical protein